ncbi:hypothetical protein T45_04153 [Streptomyces turgidiscabies]|nr:hypothetical protein T45_04153 [Streptomyces turgidiscabies]
MRVADGGWRSLSDKTQKDTARCYLHPVDWTKRGQSEPKKRASKHRKK